MLYALIKHILRMEKRIMANFDALNTAFATLSLDVRTAMDEILELTSQIKNQSNDQGAVDALTTQVNSLAQSLKDSTDGAAPTEPATTPTDTTTTPSA